MFSLIPQGVDRVEACGFTGGIDAEEEADPDGKGEGDEDGQDSNGGFQSAESADCLLDGDTEDDAEHTADDADDHGLNHELHEHVR